MKTVAIIQARMGSSRLPGKMLMLLAGVPVVKRVYDRVCRIRGLDQVLMATTTAGTDDPMVRYCDSVGIPVFRGSEEDVLDRYYQAARQTGAEVVMRITGDCPLLDPDQSARVLDLYASVPGCDYASNTQPPFLPDGLDTEVMGMEALARAWTEATAKAAREHVTYHLYKHPDRYRVAALQGEKDLSGYRWTLDNREDYVFLSSVYEELARRGWFGSLQEVLAILRDQSQWVKINAHLQRNEGLLKTIREQEGGGK